MHFLNNEEREKSYVFHDGIYHIQGLVEDSMYFVFFKFSEFLTNFEFIQWSNKSLQESIIGVRMLL